jgi:tRNA threonylcarbamoyladenosine biosynthesis protein TsaB
MYSLYIDTHDTEIVIGLYKDGNILDSRTKPSTRNHSDFTMPLVKEILDSNNIKVNDLNEILVVNGPGSFTGVRIGVTIAKTLAYTLNIPIKTITSLEMYACGTNDMDKKIVIIRDVKGVFYGLFDKDNNQIGELEYKSNADFEEFVSVNNYKDMLIEEKNIEFNKIYEQMSKKEATLAHKANPIYIKVIEALKNDSSSK